MHALFRDVLWIVLVFGVLASIWALAGTNGEWERYRTRGLVMESRRRPGEPAADAARAAAERDAEIRQMVEAANARRLRRGEPAREVEAEVARLSGTAPTGPDPGTGRPDPEVEEEVRALVALRNQRRARKGLDPLDEETEVRRELDELGMLGHRPPWEA
ncbi:hypothetical protein [Conexibacter sp. DBS9H8]|uniref:hypothetical protein n=1 Tax=Conexibacter sp. DBS9H8 TaxID=2937801 RepID=UPI00200BA343|nr:hypothetical protein [Conexibacter sp. DBS9H8]